MATKLPTLPEPTEDADYFVIKQLRYELHVVGTTLVGSEERRIDDPTKPFDRKAWIIAKRIELGEYVRPHEKERPACELTLQGAI